MAHQEAKHMTNIQQNPLLNLLYDHVVEYDDTDTDQSQGSVLLANFPVVREVELPERALQPVERHRGDLSHRVVAHLQAPHA